MSARRAIPDVLIIGGGVIGLACADRLARSGQRVTLLERGTCGREASWAGGGIIGPCSWHRDDDLARLHMDAVFDYHNFCADVHERSGIDPQFNRCGALKVLRDENRLGMAHREIDAIGQRCTPEGKPIAQTLTTDEANALEPALVTDMLAAQHCRMTAQVRNPRLLQGLALAAEGSGVEIIEGAEVTNLSRMGERITAAVTTAAAYPAGRFVICAGAWSSTIDAQLARSMPVAPVRGQTVLLHMATAPHGCILEDGSLNIVPRRDGHLLIGSTIEPTAGFNQRVSAPAIARLTGSALAIVPALASATVVASWAGLRPCSPDRRPYMGAVPEFENLFACTGHYRTGLTTAAVVAEVLTRLLAGEPPGYDLARCAPGRVQPDN